MHFGQEFFYFVVQQAKCAITNHLVRLCCDAMRAQNTFFSRRTPDFAKNISPSTKKSRKIA